MRMGFEFAQKIKANLVSVHVDRLVKEGYLERRAVEGCLLYTSDAADEL